MSRFWENCPAALGSRLLPILLTSARRAVQHTQNKDVNVTDLMITMLAALFLGLLFDPENGGSTILRNIGGVEWIHLARNRDQRPSLATTVTNPRARDT